MRKMMEVFRPAVLCFVVMTILCGIIYPGIVTGIAQGAFPEQANGSIITVTLKDGSPKDFGSALIAQEFTKPAYLIGRPMGTTNLSPVGEKQEKLVLERIAWWHAMDPDNQADIPPDLVTASGSGVDPHITPQAADYQVSRIAKARNMEEDEVRRLIQTYTRGRLLGFWGEPAVNVLQVNLALDGLL